MPAPTHSPFDEALSAASTASPWAVQAVTQVAKRAQISSEEPTVAFFAKVSTRAREEFVKFAEVKASDLYAYSDAPVVELLNAIGHLRNQIEKLEKIAFDDLEFEVETVTLWRKVGGLKGFFNISPAHDEMIATMCALAVGENAVLTPASLKGLRQALSRIADRWNISDDVLDEFTNDLEAGGFDLDLPMRFMDQAE